MSPPATAAKGSFLVESIVHSMGSLNEITIVEGQQFIGEESGDAAAGGGGGAPAAVPESSVACGASAVPLFGGAVHGGLFDDGGDSSDYFCGVRAVAEMRKGSCPPAVFRTLTKLQDVNRFRENWKLELFFFFAIVEESHINVRLFFDGQHAFFTPPLLLRYMYTSPSANRQRPGTATVAVAG